MILEWYRVDDKDIAASYEELVFRLKTDEQKVQMPYSDAQFVTVQKLQVRKKHNIEFRDLGYTFLLGNEYAAKYSKFVDNKKWENALEVAERAEEILVSLDFIESEITKPLSSIDAVRAVSAGMIKALKRRGFLTEIEEHKKSFLEDMFLRGVQFIEIDGPFELEEEGTDRDIRLKEIEIELEMLMAEPDMYYIGGWPELFHSQKELRDEEWLRETIEEELEEEKEETENNWKNLLLLKADLPIRPRNALFRNGIRTLGELVQYSSEDLLSLDGIGINSITELEKHLKEKFDLSLSTVSRLDEI